MGKYCRVYGCQGAYKSAVIQAVPFTWVLDVRRIGFGSGVEFILSLSKGFATKASNFRAMIPLLLRACPERSEGRG
jgi:hypothetical protein